MKTTGPDARQDGPVTGPAPPWRRAGHVARPHCQPGRAAGRSASEVEGESAGGEFGEKGPRLHEVLDVPYS